MTLRIRPDVSRGTLFHYLVLVSKGVVLGIAVFNLIWAFRAPIGIDMDAYWQAGIRLREGQPLFPPLANPDAADVFRYSPWFAWLWIPLTLLPRPLVTVLWVAALLAASGRVAGALARLRAWPLLAFLGPILLESSITGNVHAILICGLLFSLETRSGPLWIAIAASLKATPAVFALVYLGRRQWWRFAISVTLSILFVVPFFLYDLSSYPLDGGVADHHYGLPWMVVTAITVFGIAATPVLARTRWRWFVPALTAFLALPRAHPYNLHLLLLGLSGRVSTNARRPHKP